MVSGYICREHSFKKCQGLKLILKINITERKKIYISKEFFTVHFYIYINTIYELNSIHLKP